MANRWTDNEKEALYLVARNYYAEINTYKILEPNSEVIQTILRIAKSSRDTEAILYALEKMKFLKEGKNTHKDKRFFVNQLKQSDFLKFTVSPNYESFTPSAIIEFKNCYEQNRLKTNDVDELCSAIASSLFLSALRVKNELVNLGLIRLNTLMCYDLDEPLIEKEKDQKLKSKKLSSELEKRINTLRADISYIYDTHSKPNPSIIYSSDGTGTGKSYAVIDRFIQQTNLSDIKDGHRNLLFLTPQKAQIDIAENLKKIAEDKGIKILSFLSQGNYKGSTSDMSNIEFKNWITCESNEAVFKRWYTELKTYSYFEKYASKLKKIVGNILYYNEKLKNKYQIDSDELEEYKEFKNRNEINLIKTLNGLAQAILQEQRNGKYIPIKERFDSRIKKDRLLTEIIDFVLPFERAKKYPCILLATSDKFDCNVNIAIENKKDGKPVIKSLPFDYIIGQKIKPDIENDEGRTADKNGKPFSEQIEFLKKDYFLTDEDNYFRKNNISFTLIIDEEHIAYNKFFDRSKTTLISPNTQIAHVFSVVNRIVQSFKSANQKNSDDFVLYEAHEKFVSELRDLFENKCNISSGITLDTILRIFSNNLHHIIIDNSELEQIIHICKNVFSITPKRYFNEKVLEKIRIGSYANDTECHIYFARSQADTNPTMRDILQTLMCVFSACSHIDDTDFRSMIRHGAENSQNALLDQFVRKAISAKASV